MGCVVEHRKKMRRMKRREEYRNEVVKKHGQFTTLLRDEMFRSPPNKRVISFLRDCYRSLGSLNWVRFDCHSSSIGESCKCNFLLSFICLLLIQMNRLHLNIR